MKAALVFETQLEVVTFRDAAGAIDFAAEYVSLENLERMSEHITIKEVQVREDKYILTIHVDVQPFSGQLPNRKSGSATTVDMGAYEY